VNDEANFQSADPDQMSFPLHSMPESLVHEGIQAGVTEPLQFRKHGTMLFQSVYLSGVRSGLHRRRTHS
jgi:hypothetical protein